VFEHPELQGRHEWLVDDADVHEAMPALARQAYRRNRLDLPDPQGLPDLLKAHATVDAAPYEPPRAA
jgi:hypothetical protein